MQFDADTVGAASPAADAEICMMAADCLEALGIKRGEYIIKVNNRKVLDGLMEAIGLGGSENAGRRLTVLRAIDKLDRLGSTAVSQLLTTGRKDESGDFARGAGLSEAQADNVMRYLGFSASVNLGYPVYQRDEIEHPEFQGDEALKWLQERVELGPTGIQGLDELKQINQLTQAGGYCDGRVRIDPSVVRGLEYYTGPVLEGDLTALGPDGKAVRFGSIVGGGRYDGLVARFRGEAVPATGCSIGVSRLLEALRAINSPVLAAAKAPGPVVVAVLDRDHMADYQRLVAELRDANIAAELYLGAGGMNAQLKYADRRAGLCAVIQGSNERDAPGGRQVVIRDLVLGAELAKASKDRADYVELRQRAQQTAPEAELVARVSEVLGRHKA
jgi:histidyl-tRNA synthetase